MAFDKEAALARISSSPVRSGQVWRHVKTGGRYLVLAVALEEATPVPIVVYKGRDDVVWTRPLDVFLDCKDGAWRFVNDYDPDLMVMARTYLDKHAAVEEGGR